MAQKVTNIVHRAKQVSSTQVLRMSQQVDIDIDPPVDIFDIATFVGINIRYDTDSEVDNSLVVYMNGWPDLFLNRSDLQQNYEKVRMVVAHSIGHFLLHTKNGIYKKFDENFNTLFYPEYIGEEEILADKYAQELLMPDDITIALCQAIYDDKINYENRQPQAEEVINELSQEFQTDPSFTLKRLKDLGSLN